MPIPRPTGRDGGLVAWVALKLARQAMAGCSFAQTVRTHMTNMELFCLRGVSRQVAHHRLDHGKSTMLPTEAHLL